MRTSSEDDREQQHHQAAHAVDVALTGTRRALLGVTAGGLAQATSRLLLPVWISDNASAAEGQVEVQHRGKRRRRHRRHHALHISAAAFFALSQPVEIPRDQQTPFTFTIDLGIFHFITEDNSYFSPIRSGTCNIDLFLTWSWNGSGAAVSDTGVRVVDNGGTENLYTTRALLSRPLTTASLSQSLRLDKGDRLQVIGQVTTEQDFETPVQVTAGAMSLHAFEP